MTKVIKIIFAISLFLLATNWAYSQFYDFEVKPFIDLEINNQPFFIKTNIGADTSWMVSGIVSVTSENMTIQLKDLMISNTNPDIEKIDLSQQSFQKLISELQYSIVNYLINRKLLFPDPIWFPQEKRTYFVDIVMPISWNLVKLNPHKDLFFLRNEIYLNSGNKFNDNFKEFIIDSVYHYYQLKTSDENSYYRFTYGLNLGIDTITLTDILQKTKYKERRFIAYSESDSSFQFYLYKTETRNNIGKAVYAELSVDTNYFNKYFKRLKPNHNDNIEIEFEIIKREPALTKVIFPNYNGETYTLNLISGDGSYAQKASIKNKESKRLWGLTGRTIYELYNKEGVLLKRSYFDYYDLIIDSEKDGFK